MHFLKVIDELLSKLKMKIVSAPAQYIYQAPNV